MDRTKGREFNSSRRGRDSGGVPPEGASECIDHPRFTVSVSA
jgi:hypothetical protein